MSIHISQNEQGETRILVRAVVTSDSDLKELDELSERLGGMNRGSVVLDLSECSYLDTRVISPILHLKRRLSQVSAGLRLVVSNPEHVSFFRAIELDRIVPIKALSAAMS